MPEPSHRWFDCLGSSTLATASAPERRRLVAVRVAATAGAARRRCRMFGHTTFARRDARCREASAGRAITARCRPDAASGRVTSRGAVELEIECCSTGRMSSQHGRKHAPSSLSPAGRVVAIAGCGRRSTVTAAESSRIDRGELTGCTTSRTFGRQAAGPRLRSATGPAMHRQIATRGRPRRARSFDRTQADVRERLDCAVGGSGPMAKAPVSKTGDSRFESRLPRSIGTPATPRRQAGLNR